jgi:TolB-like protein
MKHLLVAASFLLAVQACAPTRSIVIPERPDAPARVAIVPLKGDLGPEAMDRVAEQFAARGIPVREGPSILSVIGYEANITDGSPASIGPMRKYAGDLGVDFLLAGKAETVPGPLFAFDRVRMTLQLIDVQTGETRWIGSYGDTVWAAALNTQTDLVRAAEHIALAFDEGGADNLVR